MDEVVVLSIPQIIITFVAAHGDSVSIDELHAQPP